MKYCSIFIRSLLLHLSSGLPSKASIELLLCCNIIMLLHLTTAFTTCTYAFIARSQTPCSRTGRRFQSFGNFILDFLVSAELRRFFKKRKHLQYINGRGGDIQFSSGFLRHCFFSIWEHGEISANTDLRPD